MSDYDKTWAAFLNRNYTKKELIKFHMEEMKRLQAIYEALKKAVEDFE